MNTDLKSWVNVWHPRYRRFLVLLLIIGTVVGGLVYLENTLLHGLVESLTGETADTDSLVFETLRRFGGGFRLPFVFLCAIFIIGIARALLSAVRGMVGSHMSIRSRDDLEQQILLRLLHREDEFFAEHSTGEIVNRLEIDLRRIMDRRDTLADIWWSVVVLVSNLVFFGLADWRLALVVILVCVLGTLLTERVSKPVKTEDHRYFQSNDQVKMDFEDYLKATPEIQVGGLFGAILQRFRQPQVSRFNAFMAWVRSYIRVQLSQSVWPVVAFTVAVLIVLYVHRGGESATPGNLSLIPVLIFALPRIFANVTSLVSLRIEYQLADNSIQRILEYEGLHPNSETPQTRDDKRLEADRGQSIEMENVTYRYPGPDGDLHGGVTEVSTSFPVGRWSAIIGSAGSGKSTLANLILGRLKPQAGKVRIGERDLGQGDACQLSSIASLMPQKAMLFDASIRANLLLGQSRDLDDCAFTNDDLDLLEMIGLGAICRLKAIEMRPVELGRYLDDSELLEARALVRECAAEINVEIARFEDGHVDPRQPTIDALLGGRTDGSRAVTILLKGERPNWLRRLAISELGDDLIERARIVIEQSRNLLEITNYYEFARLSPNTVDERVWRLRRECLHFAGRPDLGISERMRVVRVALTSAPSDWGADQRAADAFAVELRESYRESISALSEIVDGCWKPFEVGQIHPYLCWRDNLLFGVVEHANQRRRQKLDHALMELIGTPRWSVFFSTQGLEFEVGRNGSRLSGGQGQLVSLARALLRRTPLLVLDEPTSALDPASRDRIADFLCEWRRERVVLTISHDLELARRSDEVQVMKAGRLVNRGSFTELAERCETLRSVLRLD